MSIPTSSILSVKHLQKEYQQGEHPLIVLKNIFLEMKRGETLAILGHSGSGKTTLLSLLAGLERPTTGEIYFKEHALHQMSESSLSKLRAEHIGIVFQQYHLLENLTALENVQLPLEILSALKKSQTQRDPFLAAKELLEQVDLYKEHQGRQHHFPYQLSGGECQRVAIARALVHRPSLLLADEPSGNLDQKTGEKVMGLLFELVQHYQMTFILVTHNEELATRCHHILRLENGEFQKNSRPFSRKLHQEKIL